METICVEIMSEGRDMNKAIYEWLLPTNETQHLPRIYNDLMQQMLMVMDGDPQLFASAIRSLPSYHLFSDLQATAQTNSSILTDTFRACSMSIYFKLSKLLGPKLNEVDLMVKIILTNSLYLDAYPK